MTRSSLLVLVIVAAYACSDTDPPAEPTWQVVQEKIPGGLLRVWGRNARDVYAVGADGDGQESLALHFDGDKWTRLHPGTTGDLWWVDGVGEDDIRMVGEAGLILRYRPSTGAFERITAPEAVTLFGAWGRSPNDVWYVGGVVSAMRGIIWRDDGTAVSPVTETLTATRSTIFKTHGFSDGTVMMVGQTGQSVVYDGTSYSEPMTGTRFPLFTVHGARKDHAFAVGGVASGVIVRWDGAEWIDETPAEAPQMNGVWVVGDALAYAAGFNGRMYKREGSTWSEVSGVPTFQDLHSVWIDETGAIWACGGQLASDPPKQGVLVRYGPPIATGIEVP
jgi:hypothetical protein